MHPNLIIYEGDELKKPAGMTSQSQSPVGKGHDGPSPRSPFSPPDPGRPEPERG